MANGIDKLAKELQSMMNSSDDRKPKPYDTQAEVLRVEDGVAWVHIPGGVQETPVRLTMDAKKGDMVNVHIANGSAWITGNGTSPPTDNTVANQAQDTAAKAMTIGEMALDDATRAKIAADTAEAEAERASTAADSARESAVDASNQAEIANTYANSALSQLSIVQDVVGVLELLSTNATYRETPDTEIEPGKWYFLKVQDSPEKYEVVTNPVASELSTYYEIVSINKSVQNYVTSRLAVTSDGLWIQNPGMQTKILLSSTDGMVLRGPDGKIIGKYGSTAQIGDASGYHIKIGIWYQKTTDEDIIQGKTYYTQSGTAPDYVYTVVENPILADINLYYDEMSPELGFYDGTQKVAYISENQLYIDQSVVIRQMDVGTPISNGVGGRWSWKVHSNGENPPRNNLYLKWLG